MAGKARGRMFPLTVAMAVVLTCSPLGPSAVAVSTPPERVVEFSPGVPGMDVFVTAPSTAFAGPSISVPRNASFLDASFDVSGQLGDASFSFGDSSPADFGNGSLLRGFSTGIGGLELPAITIAAEDRFSSGGPFALDGVRSAPGGLMLSPGRTEGTVTVSGGNFSNASVVVFSPAGATPDGTSFRFDILGASGATLASAIPPGRPVDLTLLPEAPTGYRARLITAFAAQSPLLAKVRVGTEMADFFVNGTATRAHPANIQENMAPLRAPPNLRSLVRLAPDPVVPLETAPWNSYSQGTGSLIKVGSEFWLYFNSQGKIGRAVSPDLLSWTVDAQPMLGAGPDAYDANGLGVTSVVFDPNRGRYNMYYACGGYNQEPDSCLATSPDGLVWTKFAFNPVVNTVPSSWIQYRAFNPVAVITGTSYKLYIHGNADEYQSNIGLYTSSDGENFTAVPGNPIFPNSRTGYDFDVTYGTVAFNGSKFLHYYSCATSGYTWDICFADSTDGATGWTRYGPALSHDGNGFDAHATYTPTVVQDGNRLLFDYTGLTCDPVPAGCVDIRRIGAAASTYLTGSFEFTGRFDFGAVRPRAWANFSADAAVPSGGAVAYALRSSDDLASWSAYETVQNGAAPASTPVRRYVEYRVVITCSNNVDSPRVDSVRLAFAVSPRTAVFESRVFDASPYTQFTASSSSSGSVAQANWTWRNNASAPWRALAFLAPNAAIGTALAVQYRVEVVPFAAQPFAVSRVAFTTNGATQPKDVTVAVGPSPRLLNQTIAGSLGPPVRLALNATQLNAAVNLLRLADPVSATLELPLSVSAGTGGQVVFSNFSANITRLVNLPPAVIAFPSNSSLAAVAGSPVRFEVLAIDPEGDNVTVNWTVDGYPAPSGGALTQSWDEAGTRHVQAHVSSVGYDETFAWDIEVTPAKDTGTAVVATSGNFELLFLALGLVAGAIAGLIVGRRREDHEEYPPPPGGQ